jgi:hypothetical protein
MQKRIVILERRRRVHPWPAGSRSDWPLLCLGNTAALKSARPRWSTPCAKSSSSAEHPVVEYGPVPFQKKNTSLWLPKSAEIYFDFRKHRYYRRYSFDHYRLFSVDSEESARNPSVSPPTSQLPPKQIKQRRQVLNGPHLLFQFTFFQFTSSGLAPRKTRP